MIPFSAVLSLRMLLKTSKNKAGMLISLVSISLSDLIIYNMAKLVMCYWMLVLSDGSL